MSNLQTGTQPAQPDIQYHPDFVKYQDRTRRRKETESLQTTLPAGFPAQLISPLVWEGKEIENRSDWIYTLNDTQLDEIDAALKSFKALNQSLGYIDQSTLPLPTLHSTLGNLSKDIHSGRGFFVLEVFASTTTLEKIILSFTPVSHSTSAVSAAVNRLRDFKMENLRPAAEGGQSYLSSSWDVYNILAKERPQDWPVDGFNNPSEPYTVRPLLYHQPPTATTPERVLIQYARRYFTGLLAQPRSTDIPPITEAQADALEALHFLAEKHSASLDLQKGDVQYVNNLSIFHARNGYRDEPGKEFAILIPEWPLLADLYRRHLLRLWLRDPENAWETPSPLQHRWDTVFKDVTENEQVFPLGAGLEQEFRVLRDSVDAFLSAESLPF